MTSHAEANLPTSVEEVPYPTWTQVVNLLMGKMGEIAIVAATGAGAPIDVSAGSFDPKVAVVLNQTDNQVTLYMIGMTANTARDLATGLSVANGVTLGAEGEFKVTLGAGVQGAADSLLVMLLGAR